MHLYIITPQRRSQSTFSKRPSPKLTHLLPPSSDQVQRRQHGHSRSSGVRGRPPLPSPQRSSSQRLAHRCRHHRRSLAQEQGHPSRSQHSEGSRCHHLRHRGGKPGQRGPAQGHGQPAQRGVRLRGHQLPGSGQHPERAGRQDVSRLELEIELCCGCSGVHQIKNKSKKDSGIH